MGHEFCDRLSFVTLMGPIADGSMPGNGSLPDDVANELHAWVQSGQPE